MVNADPYSLDFRHQAHMCGHARSCGRVRASIDSGAHKLTVVILEEGLWNANESPFLKRNAVVVGEDSVGGGRGHARCEIVSFVN